MQLLERPLAIVFLGGLKRAATTAAVVFALLAPLSASAADANKTPVYAATLAKAGGKWVVTPRLPCRSGGCRGKRITLDGYDSVRLRGLIDMRGAPATLRHQLARDQTLPQTLPAAAKMPAAALLAGRRSKGERANFLVLVTLAKAPRILVAAQLSSRRKDGGGFSTINAVRFEREKPGQPLAVMMTQTSLPRRGARVFRPGPPLRFVWRYRNGKYVRGR